MVGVIQRTAMRRGISVARQARAYSAVFKTSHRPWLWELNLRGTRPPSWPRASWARYRLQWLRLVAHVRAVLAGRVFDKCAAEAPEHFGSLRLDGHRMRKWVRVCEWVHPRQAFWRRR